MNEFDREMKQTLDEFAEVTNMMAKIDISRLPFNLQLSLLNQYAKLTKTIKEVTDETKKIIVMASILGRS